MTDILKRAVYDSAVDISCRHLGNMAQGLESRRRAVLMIAADISSEQIQQIHAAALALSAAAEALCDVTRAAGGEA